MTSVKQASTSVTSRTPVQRDDIWRRLEDRAAAITQINSPAQRIWQRLSLSAAEGILNNFPVFLCF